jgi:hypothetical protein
VDLVKNQAIVDEEGLELMILSIPEDMFDEVKEYRSILIEGLIMMRICLKNSWKMKTYYRGRNQQSIKSCCNGYGYHSYDCWFFF